MDQLSFFYTLVLLIQLLHSIEELVTGFHKKWYLIRLPFRIFLSFEIVFNLFWISVLLIPVFAYRNYFQAFFMVLMFANGIQHVVWAASVKQYVPGLLTGIIHICLFLFFYFLILFR